MTIGDAWGAKSELEYGMAMSVVLFTAENNSRSFSSGYSPSPRQMRATGTAPESCLGGITRPGRSCKDKTSRACDDTQAMFLLPSLHSPLEEISFPFINPVGRSKPL